jgi:dUTPase
MAMATAFAGFVRGRRERLCGVNPVVVLAGYVTPDHLQIAGGAAGNVGRDGSWRVVGRAMLPGSGVGARHGTALVNAAGLTDSGYRGELRVLLLNTDRNHEYRVSAGGRIAQLVAVPMAQLMVAQVSELTNSARGVGGFGSSGVRARRSR